MRRHGKYNARRTFYDGRWFASAKEARRYQELRLLELAGEIQWLEVQPRFDLRVNSTKVCTYIGDFRYNERGQLVVEDVKSGPTRTPVYRLKAKMLKAQEGIEIREV